MPYLSRKLIPTTFVCNPVIMGLAHFSEVRIASLTFLTQTNLALRSLPCTGIDKDCSYNDQAVCRIVMHY